MTARKYRRLLLVLLLPLLIAGSVLWRTTGAWEERYAYILCSPFLDREECRNIGPSSEEPRYKSVKNEYSTWFDVMMPDTGRSRITHESVQVSGRMIPNLKIVGVQPLFGSAQMPRNLVGELVAIQFGITENDRSNIDFNPIVLACNSLWFDEDTMLYSTQCRGEGWTAEVKFDESGSSAQQLSKLRVAIYEAIDQHRSEYFWFTALLIIAPLVLFVLASGLAWTAIKATSYVRSG